MRTSIKLLEHSSCVCFQRDKQQLKKKQDMPAASLALDELLLIERKVRIAARLVQGTARHNALLHWHHGRWERRATLAFARAATCNCSCSQDTTTCNRRQRGYANAWGRSQRGRRQFLRSSLCTEVPVASHGRRSCKGLLLGARVEEDEAASCQATQRQS